ncbi:MAG: response regulator, partial [Planctomycetes bacterium]|nr:response regulator [Planctomycetota bacterium]
MKTSVMVVDDDPSILRFIQANLEARGFHVTPASDGESALKLCEQVLPDVILLDITLPGINGLEVCHRIRQWSNVPIIIISANVGRDCRDTVLKIGANDYMSKPFGV